MRRKGSGKRHNVAFTDQHPTEQSTQSGYLTQRQQSKDQKQFTSRTDVRMNDGDEYSEDFEGNSTMQSQDNLSRSARGPGVKGSRQKGKGTAELNDAKSLGNPLSLKSTYAFSQFNTASTSQKKEKLSSSRSPVLKSGKKNLTIFQEDQPFSQASNGGGQKDPKNVSTRYDNAVTVTEQTTTVIRAEQEQTNQNATEAVRKAGAGILIDDPRQFSEMKIEKERLEKTVIVLQQKLNDKCDTDELSELLHKGKRAAEKERDELKELNFNLKNQIKELNQHKTQLEQSLKEHIELLKQANQQNEVVTNDINEVNKMNINLQSENAQLVRLDKENKIEIENLRKKFEKINRENDQLISENIDLKARISELEKQLKLTLEENTSFKEIISKFKFELNSVREQTSKEIFELKEDKISLKNHIEAQFNQISEQKGLMKTKDQEIDFLIKQKD